MTSIDWAGKTPEDPFKHKRALRLVGRESFPDVNGLTTGFVGKGLPTYNYKSPLLPGTVVIGLLPLKGGAKAPSPSGRGLG